MRTIVSHEIKSERLASGKIRLFFERQERPENLRPCALCDDGIGESETMQVLICWRCTHKPAATASMPGNYAVRGLFMSDTRWHWPDRTTTEGRAFYAFHEGRAVLWQLEREIDGQEI
jgi:hypothetical protein